MEKHLLDDEKHKQLNEYIMHKIDANKNEPFQINEELENYAIEYEKLIFDYIKTGKFEMHYQPKFESDEQTTKSAEALFRVKNPDNSFGHSIINPEIVFYLLKEFGDEKAVVLKQVETICKDINKYDIAKTEPDFRISLNVALDCLDNDFVEKVISETKKNKISPKNLQIEILETEDFSKIATHREIIDKLKSLGVTFALDDFGSRNAKDISVLELLDFDEVKIDRSLVEIANYTKNYNNLQTLYNTIKSKQNSPDIVLEGVDGLFNKGTHSYTIPFETVIKNLRRIGQLKYQGYGFKKPMTASELGSLVKSQNGLENSQME